MAIALDTSATVWHLGLGGMSTGQVGRLIGKPR